MTRRQRDGAFAIAVAQALAAAAVAFLIWLFGLFHFIAGIPSGALDPSAPVPEEQRTDAVVVLTGGHGRLQAGFTLLEQGGAKKLFISGVYDGVAVRELLRLTAKARDGRECCVVLGYAAGDTIGNAAETSDWMEEENFTSLRLVTSNYHMPRALAEFEMAMPDVRIVPHPVASPNVHVEDWWRRRGTAHLLMAEYSKYLVAALRHRLADLLEE